MNALLPSEAPWPPASNQSGLPRAAVTGTAVVTREGFKRARSGMPWLRADDVVSYEGDGGAFCDLNDENGLSVGTALWDPMSGIRARLLSTTRTHDPLGLLITRLERAEHRRAAAANTAVRLCHGEADAVPGLFIDRLGDGLHVDVDAAGLLPWLDELLAGTVARQRCTRVVLRRAGLSGHTTSLLQGTSSWQSYVQDRLHFEVDLADSDVRRLSAELDPMLRLRPFAKGRVLDVFANTGGFGLHLVDAGAQHAVLVDESSTLPARATKAAQKNGLGNKIDVVTADPGAWLKQVQGCFDVVVCHPPHQALARDRAEKRAVDIASSALKLVNEGSIFCARSASAALDDERFAAALQEVATQLRRRLQVLARLGPGPDHPTLAGTPMPPSILVMRVLSTG